MADKKEDDKKDDDERLEFIYKYLVLSRKIKIEKWVKMLTNEEFKETIMRFFNVPSEMILIMQLNPAGLLVPFLEIPTTTRSKMSYFIKKNPVKITKENYRDVIIPGDMAPKPVEELSVLIEEAFVPILSNPRNHKDWPHVVSEDVKNHIYDMRSIICQVKGKMAGQTILPMPMDTERIFQAEWRAQQNGDIDVRLKSNIEAIVAKWSSQISDVLHEESTCAFVGDKHPLPSAEIQFWQRRLENVGSIYDQMRDPRVKKMASILELTNSPYSPRFKTLLKDVAIAVMEARDICSHLKALEPHFEDIENTEFPDIQPKLKPLMHCICLMWSNSKYYCTSTRIITLLLEISNLLIAQAVKYLDQNSLFTGDVEDSLKRLECVATILTYYTEVFETFRSVLEAYFRPPAEPIPWNFHDNLVLGRISDFQKRLQQIKSLFETAQEYFKLERIELASLKGRTLCFKINDIYEGFVKIYTEIAEIQYDILLPEETRFVDQLTPFFVKVEEFDRKLSSIFDQAFFECHNMESMFKVIWIMGSMANRPIIMAQLWHNYEKLLQKIQDHFNDIKIIFDCTFKDSEKAEWIEISQYFPSVAGALCILAQLRQRIEYPMQYAGLLDHPLISLRLTRDIKPKYDQLQSLVDAMEEEIFTSWAGKINDISAVHLAKSLLIIDDEQLLRLNFDPELTELLREIRYMIIMKRTDLPEEAVQLYHRTQYFFESTYNLSLIVQWYNRIRNYSSPVEFELMRDEVEKMDELILFGQRTYDWNSPGKCSIVCDYFIAIRR